MFKNVFGSRLHVDTHVDESPEDPAAGTITAGAQELLAENRQRGLIQADSTHVAPQAHQDDSHAAMDDHQAEPGPESLGSTAAEDRQGGGPESTAEAHHYEASASFSVPALCEVATSHAYMQQQQEQEQEQHWEQSPAAYDTGQQLELQQQVLQQLPSQQQPQQQWQQQQRQQQQPHQQPQQWQQQQGLLSPTIQQLQQKLYLEAKAREELEDMLLRYERQFKAESAARLAAEQAAAAAQAAAADVRQQLASNGRQAKQHCVNLAGEQEAVRQERAALESMRVDFEAQLHTARGEVAKTQAAMAYNEERVRASEASERARLAAEYEMRMAALLAELERLREELAVRTQSMTAEMDRWKRQATLTAAAVVEAKNEVLDRKRELDSTKDKMDHLVEKLYGHREANMSLSGAIAAAANYQQAATNSFLMQQANSFASLSGAQQPTLSLSGGAPLMMYAPAGSSAGQAAAAASAPGDTGFLEHTAAHTTTISRSGKAAGSSTAGKPKSKALVPTAQRQAGKAQGHALNLPSPSRQASQTLLSPTMALQQALNHGAFQPPVGSLLNYTGSMQHIQQQQQQRGARAGSLGGGGLVSHIPQLPPVDTAHNSPTKAAGNNRAASRPRAEQAQGRGRNTNAWDRSGGAGSYAELHQQQQGLNSPSAAATAGAGANGDVFGHVTSKYAQSAAKYSQVHQAKAKKQQKQRAMGQQKLPDRFAEGSKNAAMITAMASKW